MSNPFAQTMVRMQVPAHMGRNVSVRGFALEADADGCIEVPSDVASELEPHGLVRWSPAAEPKAKK